MSEALALTIAYVDRQRHIKDPFYVAAVALLSYDYILTLQLEIKHIWLSSWTYTKVVFLLVRYMPFVFSVLLLNYQLAVDVPESVCTSTLPVAVWMSQINILLSESILAIRTWAIWRRNRVVGVGLASMMLASVVVFCILTPKFVGSLGYAPPLYPGYRGCLLPATTNTSMMKHSLGINYAVRSAAQGVVLMLMGFSAYRSYRAGNNNQLLHVIHRDGIMFYVYLLAVSTTNVCLILTLQPDIMTVLSPIEGVMYSVCVTRTILNIRSTASIGMSRTTELHTTDFDTLTFDVRLDQYNRPHTLRSRS